MPDKNPSALAADVNIKTLGLMVGTLAFLGIKMSPATLLVILLMITIAVLVWKYYKRQVRIEELLMKEMKILEKKMEFNDEMTEKLVAFVLQMLYTHTEQMINLDINRLNVAKLIHLTTELGKIKGDINNMVYQSKLYFDINEMEIINNFHEAYTEFTDKVSARMEYLLLNGEGE
jgi:Ca2+/Na+ antiporter